MLFPFVGTASVFPRGVYSETCGSWRLSDVISWIRHKFAEVESFHESCRMFAVSGDVLRASINRYLLFGDRMDVERFIEWDMIKKLAHQYNFNLDAVDLTEQRICFAMVEDRPHEIIFLSVKGESQSKEIPCQDEIGNQMLLFSKVNGEIMIKTVVIGKSRKLKASDSKEFANAKQ